jgi:hypothetical protein
VGSGGARDSKCRAGEDKKSSWCALTDGAAAQRSRSRHITAMRVSRSQMPPRHAAWLLHRAARSAAARMLLLALRLNQRLSVKGIPASLRVVCARATLALRLQGCRVLG